MEGASADDVIGEIIQSIEIPQITMLKRFYKSLFFARRWYWLFVGGDPAVRAFLRASLFLFTIAQLLSVVPGGGDHSGLPRTIRPQAARDRRRALSDRMSNGDSNPVVMHVENGYPFPVSLRIIDELPDQFQLRNFSLMR